MGPHRRFLLVVGAGLVVAFLLDALSFPPDPYTQLLVVGSVMLVVLPLAVVLAYLGGAEFLARRLL